MTDGMLPQRKPANLPARRGSVSEAEELLSSVRRCTLCQSLPLGPRPILQLHPSARILIAGQAPGRRAHERGIPFDDPSGDRLRAWLGVDRGSFYDPTQFAILPMGFCFPGSGRSGDLPPRSECAKAWRSRLLAFLPNIELTLVLGQYAQAWHISREQTGTLTQLVAEWRRFWPALLPLPHPSPRNLRWFRINPFFEEEILPVLRGRIRELLQ